MKIKVTDQWSALVKDDTLVQNSLKVYFVDFDFDKSWEGFSKTVLFEAGPASVIVALRDDSCTVPAECLKRGSVDLKVGVYGVKGPERKGTFWCMAGKIVPDIKLGAGSGSSRPPIPDDVYAEIMAAIGDLNAAGFQGMTLAEVFQEILNSTCGTATDEEVDEILDANFESNGDPGGSNPGNTATDQEIDAILDAVFGKL